MIAVLVGKGADYKGTGPRTLMSDQILVRVGGASTDSIYRDKAPGR